MKNSIFNNNTVVRACVATALGCIMIAPALAHRSAPVSLSLSSPDSVNAGQPVNVYVHIRAGQDVPHASFETRQSTDWQILDGTSLWTGSIPAAKDVEFQFRAVPLKDDPEPLRGALRVPQYPDHVARLDPARMGGKFPERGREESTVGNSKSRSATRDEDTAAEPEDTAGLPEPAAATEPRIPGRPESPQPASVTRTGKGKAASVSVTARGRFVFVDTRGNTLGVRNATVELWDRNPAPSFGDTLCARGITTGNGNFTLVGNCGDFFDGPDLFVRIVLNNTTVEVKPPDIFAGSFTFESNLVANSPGGVVDFGAITITANQRAFQTHNAVMRASQFMAGIGETIPKVAALFPAEATQYVPVLGHLHISTGVPFGEVADIFHEYAHHILHTRAESPIPDYINGNCDPPDSTGHCIWQPERGVISWTEGFPDFFGALLHRAFRTADLYPNTTKYDFEANSAENPFDFPGEEDMTEGVIASVLWDIVDVENDDQGQRGAGRRDNLSIPFSAVWNIIRTFDPSGDLFHNHPTSIHEFWDGLKQLRLNDINRVSEVYREHNIVKPQPNLKVTALLNAPNALAPGLTFSVNNTITNAGDERVNSPFSVRFDLVTETRTPVAYSVGSRGIAANLLAGASSATSTALQVPSTIPLGTYRLRACADSPNAVPESDEADNCVSTGRYSIVR